MANGEFLRGISRGIFGEQERAFQRQEAQDKERKGQLIDLLSNLAPQVEPSSLPLLMGHLGDVIGIKGKMRKFWDVFSGQPDMTPEAQMGDLVRNLSSQLTSPDTARSARGKATLGSISGALGSGVTPYEDPMKGKIVFRDPRKEKLGELEARYGAQLETQRFMQDERHRDALERQAESYRLKGVQDQIRYNQKIFLARDRLAESIFGSGGAKTIEEAKGLADTQLANRNEAELDLLLEKIPFYKAKTAEAQAIAEGGGISPAERRRLGIAERGERRGVSTNLGQAASDEARALEDMKGAASAINDALKLVGGAVVFDGERGVFVPRDSSSAGAATIQGIEALPNIIKLRADYTDARGRLEKARTLKGTFEGQQQELKNVTKPPAVTPKSKGDVHRVGMGTTRKVGQWITRDVPNPDSYPLGRVIVDPNTKKRFSIERKVGNTLYLLPIQ